MLCFQGEICSFWKREVVIVSWLTFLYHYLSPTCHRLCKISVLLLSIALIHPKHVHSQQLPSMCKQGQPQSQQEDSIIHMLKCLQAPQLRFSQAISAVVCFSFDASFNTFQRGLFIAKHWALGALGPFQVSGWAIPAGGTGWSVSPWIKSSGRELVKWCVPVNALGGLNGEWNTIVRTPPPLASSVLSCV